MEKRETLKTKKGSVFSISLIFAMVILFTSATLMQFQLHYLKILHKNIDRTTSFYMAESAIQLAKWQIAVYSSETPNLMDVFTNGTKNPLGWISAGSVGAYSYFKYTDLTDNKVYTVAVKSS